MSKSIDLKQYKIGTVVWGQDDKVGHIIRFLYFKELDQIQLEVQWADERLTSIVDIESVYLDD